jgi:protein TonB
LLAIMFWPRAAVEEIPVRTLNITLGAPDMKQVVQSKPAPVSAPKPAPPKSKVKVEPPKPKPLPKVKPKPEAKKPAPAKKAPSKPMIAAPSQFVRKPAVQAEAVARNESPAQAKARYEQTISAWLQRHRVVPEAARTLGQHGSPVVRVRINRQGAVIYFAVERSSGYELIDQAAMDMVRRANPFPTPPVQYPGGQMLEFLMPVTFDLR